jgi:Holliday junction resolvase RusA-like endonuclease
MNELSIDIKPIGKPRMTQSDRWKKRGCVVAYWNFKDCLVDESKKQNFILSDNIDIEFHFKPNESLSEKKKQNLIGKPHRVKPDLDNCIKSVFDCLHTTDQEIYEISARKYYGVKDKIIIRNKNNII